MLVFKRFYDVLSIVVELIAIALLSVPYVSKEVIAQDGGFELPVQLVGFPVIIMLVRMSNFVKKLAYSLNPSTYRRSARKTRKADFPTPPINLAKMDQELFKQLGPNYCVYEDVCFKNVKSSGAKSRADWEKIITEYSRLPQNKQQHYLLSVFLGDIMRSAKLCQHFKETGRICH